MSNVEPPRQDAEPDRWTEDELVAALEATNTPPSMIEKARVWIRSKGGTVSRKQVLMGLFNLAGGAKGKEERAWAGHYYNDDVQSAGRAFDTNSDVNRRKLAGQLKSAEMLVAGFAAGGAAGGFKQGAAWAGTLAVGNQLAEAVRNDPGKPPAAPTSPSTPQSAGTGTTTGGTGEFDPTATGGQARTFDLNELAYLYRTGAVDLTQLPAVLAAQYGMSSEGAATYPVFATGVEDAYAGMSDTRRAQEYQGPKSQVRRISYRDAVNYTYSLKPEELRVLQEKLIDAGLMDPNAVAKKQIRWGNPSDKATRDAWEALLETALANPDKTIPEVIEWLKASRPAAYDMALSGSSPIRLTDPATIRQTTQAVDKSVLGRTGDNQRYVQIIHDAEKEAGMAAQLQAGTYSDVDLEARIREAVRAENPAEAEAHDLAAQFASFMSMLRGPSYSVR